MGEPGALEIAQHLAEQHTNYFLPNNEPIGELVDGELAPVLRTALSLQWEWLNREIRAAGRPRDRADALHKAVAGVRRVGLPHHKVRGIMLTTSAHAVGFKPTSWFRMALGVMNCESLNFLLLVWLRQLGFEAYMFEAGRDDQGGSHTLTVAIQDGQWAFVDAWTDAPAVVVSQEELADRFGQDLQFKDLSLVSPIPGIPTHAELVAAGVRVDPTVLMRKERFVEGRSFPMGALYQPEDGVPPPPAEEANHPLDPGFLQYENAQAPPPSVFTRFLSMRNRVLFDPEADARALYRDFLERERIGGVTHALVEALADDAESRA